jgi:hypothetical protein
MRPLALACLALLALGSGCLGSGHDRSVLDDGLRLGVSSRVHKVAPTEAFRRSRLNREYWLAKLRRLAREYPHERFQNPSRAELIERLDDLAREYGFDVVSAQVLHPRQAAPMIVVRTSHYLALAHATSSILKQLNPRESVGDDRLGWRYEGFYWEARDQRGVPFLITTTLTRGPIAEGGQWARSEPLFPYSHG